MKDKNRTKKAKMVLIAPPQAYMLNALAIPQLTAYLKSKGRLVEQMLVDTDIYNFLLSPPEMERIFRKIKEELLPKAKLDAKLREALEERLSCRG